MICIVSTCLAAAAPARDPIPKEEAVQEAEKVVREVLAREIELARTGSQLAALSQRLREEAVWTTSDPVARWVLFEMARQYAVQASDLQQALVIVEDMGSYFDTNGIQLRLETLEELADRSNSSTFQRNLSIECLDSVERAIAKDEVECAGRFVELAR
jgi:hypothetical protein